MGIVVKQSIKNMIITCLGFGVGAINTLFLYTNFLEDRYYGMITYLISAANMAWPFIAFGTQNTLVKFFSYYTTKKTQDQFLGMMLVLPLLISIVLGAIGYVSYHYIQSFFENKNVIVQPYLWTIFVLAFFIAYFELFFAWAKVKLKSVFGTFLKELFVRVGVMILLILVYYEILSIPQFIYGVVLVYGIRMLVMLSYAFQQHSFSFHFSFPKNYPAIFRYTALIVISGSVATVLIDLDKVMIEQFLPIENVAKYGLCAYIASVIILPSRAMHQITYPLTAKLINEKKYTELGVLYRKSSGTLFVLSGLLFLLILSNVKQLFEFIPDTYELMPYVIFCIAFGKLYDNFLGNTNSILYTSKYYVIVLWVGVGMAVLALALNILMIPVFGIKGAAIATFLTITVYNTIKLWIVYRKFNMHPFSKEAWMQLGAIVIFMGLFYVWDFSYHPVINIVLKSILITMFYGVFVYSFTISPTLIAFVKSHLKLEHKK